MPVVRGDVRSSGKDGTTGGTTCHTDFASAATTATGRRVGGVGAFRGTSPDSGVGKDVCLDNRGPVGPRSGRPHRDRLGWRVGRGGLRGGLQVWRGGGNRGVPATRGLAGRLAGSGVGLPNPEGGGVRGGRDWEVSGAGAHYRRTG